MSKTATGFFDLFGLRYDDPNITEFLAGQPAHRADGPSDGSQYIISKEGGFDLLFEDETYLGGAGNKQNRVLSAVFLYNEGADKHSRFLGKLPFDFSFDDDCHELRQRKIPDRTWVIGEGRVSLDHPEPDHDRWELPPLIVSARYDGLKVHHFQISFRNDEPEWIPPETWESLALLPDRKLDAIRLYREKHGVGMAEAKLAVELHANGNKR